MEVSEKSAIEPFSACNCWCASFNVRDGMRSSLSLSRLDMHRVAIPKPVRWPVVILVAALVTGLLAAPRARASCGDYVTMRPHDGDSVQPVERAPGHFESTFVHLASRDAIAALAMGPLVAVGSPRSSSPGGCPRCPGGLPAGEPCRGPWCKGSPSPLSPPSAPPVQHAREGRAGGSAGWCCRCRTSPASPRERARPSHPPRLSARSPSTSRLIPLCRRINLRRPSHRPDWSAEACAGRRRQWLAPLRIHDCARGNLPPLRDPTWLNVK